MQKTFLFVVVFLLLFIKIVSAQNIPNGDFEEWPTCLCDPPYWYTNNLYPPPLECLQVSPGFPSYSGDFSIKGVVDSCTELSVLYPPILTSYDIDLNTKPEALHGFYKYSPIGEDLFFATVKLYKDSVLIGEGFIKSEQEVTDFTEFVVNFDYNTNDIPDMAVIEFTIDSSLNDNQLHQGSTWYLDSLTFGPLSDISSENNKLPLIFNLYQNYPNPFNPSTRIGYSIPELSLVIIKVHDVLGNEIMTLVNEEQPVGYYSFEFDATLFSSGVYFYQLKASNPSTGSVKSFVETKKMMILK